MTTAALLAGLALGALSLRGQHHYATLRDSGAALNGMALLLATGPTALTAWPGWVAAACFGLAVRRLRHGDPEPPIGLDGGASVAELRARLRAEHRAVVVALWLLGLLSLLDGGRLLWYAAAALTDALARHGLPALAAEVAGLAVAALVLRRWVAHFAAQLELLGAL